MNTWQHRAHRPACTESLSQQMGRLGVQKITLLIVTLCAFVPSLSARKMRLWQAPGKTGNAITPRNSMGLATARGRLYLFGGDGGDVGTLSDLHVFDPTTLVWEDLSKALVGTAACRETNGMGFASVGNRLYSFGGYIFSGSVSTSTSSNALLDHLCIFDLAEMAWKSTDSVSGERPSARGGMGFASAGENVYLFGGFGGSNLYLNDLHVLDTSEMAWQSKVAGAAPSARAFMGFASDGSMLYLFGGVGASGNTTNDLHMFDPSTTTWQDLSQKVTGSMPSTRAFMGFTAAGSKLFLFGGRETVEGPSVNYLHMLDLSEMVWEDLSAASFLGASVSVRSFMGFSAVGQKLYVIGGLGDDEGYGSNRLDDVHILDPTTKTSTDLSVTGTPSARNAFGFEPVAGSLYMFGGKIGVPGSADIICNDFYRFDPSTMAWQDLSNSTLGPTPSPRYDFGFTSLNDKIYVFGGGTTGRSTGYVNELHVFDASQLLWEDFAVNITGSAPSPRTNMAFAAVRDALYVFGGNVNVWLPSTYLGDFHMLDLSAMEWHNLEGLVTGPQPSARAYMEFALADGDKLYLFGGRGTSGEYLNDLYAFDTTAMEWKDLTASTTGLPPPPRRGYGIAAGLGKLFVVGGRGPKDYLNDVQVLHISDSGLQWDDLSQSTASAAVLPTVEKIGLAFIDGTFYSFGGWGFSEEGGWAHSNTFAVWKASRTIHATWTDTTVLSDLVQCYDWDSVVLGGRLDKSLDLCSSYLPCELSLSGAPAGLQIEPEGRVQCSRISGCARLSLDSTDITCVGHRAREAFHVSSGAHLVMSRTTVAGGAADSDGAFLAVVDGATAELSQARFRGFRTLGAGGAVLVRDASLQATASEFRECAAAEGGGAIAASGRSSLLLRDCVFGACASGQEGGCILSLGSETAIEGCSFESARSESGGGAVSACGTLRVEQSTFRDCWSAGSGGAVHARGIMDGFRPQEAAVSLRSLLFANCSAQADGGAVAVQGGQCVLSNSTLSWNTAHGRGGAVAAEKGAHVSAEACLFERNAAALNGGALSVETGALRLSSVALVGNEGAAGGGGVFVKDAEASLLGVRAATNAARQGGGGALLWHGETAPSIEGLDCAAAGCGVAGAGCGSNSARYGSCVASGYKAPLVVSCPARATAGEAFAVAVTKRDYYNQTITSDSASVLEVKARLFPSARGGEDAWRQTMEPDPSTEVLGSFFLGLRNGEAEFSIALRPIFASWDAENGTAQLLRSPVIQFEGLDVQVGGTLLSDPLPVGIEDGNSVCPRGSVLELTETAAGMRGACKRCAAGTYSLNPLLSPLLPPGLPACLACPAGARCPGGDTVDFAAGTWAAVDGRFLLRGCPAGHELVNAVDGVFSHEAQRCRPCTTSQYILNPDTDTCQPCPRGLQCSGSAAVQSVVEGATWVARGSLWVLVACPSGHRLAPAEDEEFFAADQRCEPCDEGWECAAEECKVCSRCAPGFFKAHKGTSQCEPCPANTFRAEAGAAELLACLQCPAAASTLGRTAQSTAAACVCDPGHYPLLGLDTPTCQPCPLGASCNGTALQASPGSEWEQEGSEMRLVACAAGSILVRNDAFSASDECVACPFGKYSLLPAAHPATLSVRSASVAAEACSLCPKGMTCYGAADIRANRGHWLANTYQPEPGRRSDSDSPNATRGGVSVSGATRQRAGPALAKAVVVPCPPKACGAGVCNEGHTGPVCGFCEEGYVLSGYSCRNCGSAAGVTMRRGVAGGLAVGLFLAVYAYFAVRPAVYGESAEMTLGCCSGGLCARVSTWVKEHYWDVRDNVKISLSFYQVVSTYRSSFSTNWPTSMSSVFDFAAASRLEFLSIPWISCVAVGATFQQMLLFYTLVPVGICLLLAFPIAVLRLAQSPNLPHYIDQCWRLLGAFLFLVYPTLSVFSLSAFNCQRITDDLNLLVADYREHCPTDNPSGFLFTYSLICVVLFPLGIPLVAFWVMRVCNVPKLAQEKAQQAQLHAMILLYIKQRADRIMDGPASVPNGSPFRIPPDSPLRNSPITTGLRNSPLAGGMGWSSPIGRTRTASVARQERRPSAERLASIAITSDVEYLDLHHEFEGNELENELTEQQIITLLTHDWRPSAAPPTRASAGLSSSDDSGSSPPRSPNSLSRGGPAAVEQPCSLPLAPDPAISVWGMTPVAASQLRGRPRQQQLLLLKEAAMLLTQQGVLTMPALTWDGSLGAAEVTATSRLGFLLLTYKPQYWWFELLELWRKVFTVCVVVFLWPRSVRQIAAALAVTFFALLGTMKLQPYRSSSVMDAQVLSLLVQCCTLFYGTIITATDGEDEEESGGESGFASTLLVILFCLTPVCPVILAGLRRFKNFWARRNLARASEQGFKFEVRGSASTVDADGVDNRHSNPPPSRATGLSRAGSGVSLAESCTSFSRRRRVLTDMPNLKGAADSEGPLSVEVGHEARLMHARLEKRTSETAQVGNPRGTKSSFEDELESQHTCIEEDGGAASASASEMETGSRSRSPPSQGVVFSLSPRGFATPPDMPGGLRPLSRRWWSIDAPGLELPNKVQDSQALEEAARPELDDGDSDSDTGPGQVYEV